MVRESLLSLGLDRERAGTASWNPLHGLVRPGNLVVIKPNLVRDFRESAADDADCLVTHGSVIRAAVDYAYIALEGRGRIVIADAPHNDADFESVLAITKIEGIRRFYRELVGFEVELYDLRPECATKVDGVIVNHRKLVGDPAGYARVNLATDSMFEEIGDLCSRLYGAEYDRRELVSHHRDGRHEYLVSRTILQSDCIISLPKLKTHKKTGLTANMKNLVGINGNKNWLPHHREGTPAQGGDQFAEESLLRRTEQAAVAAFKQVFPLLGPLRGVVAGPLKHLGKRTFGDTNKDTIRSGNWYGNDTTWRMVIDLNRALHYFDANGVRHPHPIRNFFTVVDGVVGGEGNGPLDPTPVRAGLIVAGHNPVTVDTVCARLMGFDHNKIPMLRRSFAPHALRLVPCEATAIEVRSLQPDLAGPLATVGPSGKGFRPHFGWKGHIELSESESRATTAVT